MILRYITTVDPNKLPTAKRNCNIYGSLTGLLKISIDTGKKL